MFGDRNIEAARASRSSLRTAVGVALAIGVEELQGNLPAEPRVFSDVDLTRAARPEPLMDVVVQDGLSGQSRWHLIP